jgi:hypothetical protein
MFTRSMMKVSFTLGLIRKHAPRARNESQYRNNIRGPGLSRLSMLKWTSAKQESTTAEHRIRRIETRPAIETDGSRSQKYSASDELPAAPSRVSYG